MICVGQASNGIPAAVTFTVHGDTYQVGTGWTQDMSNASAEVKTGVVGGAHINTDEPSSTPESSSRTRQSTYQWDVAATLTTPQPGVTSLKLTVEFVTSVSYTYGATIGWSEPDSYSGGVSHTDASGLSAKTNVKLGKLAPVQAICVGLADDLHQVGFQDSHSLAKTITGSKTVTVTLTSTDGTHFSGILSLSGLPLSGNSNVAFRQTGAIYTNTLGSFELWEYNSRVSYYLG